MIELNLNELILALVASYGSPIVAGVLLLDALGLPLPSTLIVTASGAFVRQEFLDIYTTPILGLLGVVTGDTIVYGVGRFARLWIRKRFGQSAAWKKAQNFFERRGSIAIYLTRWLITPIAIPTNLIAASSDYPFSRWFLFDLAGVLTWIVLYGTLGYAFGSQWELIGEYISNLGTLILGLAALGVGLYVVFRFRQKARHLRFLAITAISPHNP